MNTVRVFKGRLMIGSAALVISAIALAGCGGGDSVEAAEPEQGTSSLAMEGSAEGIAPGAAGTVIR